MVGSPGLLWGRTSSRGERFGGGDSRDRYLGVNNSFAIHIDRGEFSLFLSPRKKKASIVSWLTQNSWYIRPSVHLCPRDTRSARPSPVVAPAIAWPLIRWRGHWPEPLTVGVRGGSGCGPGCRFSGRWRERLWKEGRESRVMRRNNKKKSKRINVKQGNIIER